MILKRSIQKQIGISHDEFNDTKIKKGLTWLALQLCAVDRKHAMSHEVVFAMLDDAQVSVACIVNTERRASNEDVAALKFRYVEKDAIYMTPRFTLTTLNA